MNIRETDKKYIAGTYGRFDLALVRGKGSLAYDENGREYIDLGTGIAVNIFGIGDDEWKNAVTSQLDAIPHASNLYFTEPCARLAEMLCKKTGMSKIFFGNSGAEANECAIKAARKWGLDSKGEGYSTIITLKNSFHGRTVTTLAATGQDSFHTDFGPFTEGFVYADDPSEVEKLADENKCCAVMMELVQGEGGIHVLSKEFVGRVLQIAKEKNLLVIIDEVQTGNGRTGELYAYMNYGFTPDIFTTAKGLGGGLPIGACVFGEKTADVLTPGSHGSTFGGNPAACAGACSILGRIDSALLEGVKKKSEYIISQLENAKGVENISGMGLMLGVKPVRPKAEIIEECMQNGVLVLGAKDKIRLLPALNIPDDLLAKGIDILKEALAKC
ncbi:MAG: aminotransferase class III-fold pyridoxal phosphate-dependent enzyme [Clostridia bacterium]|nr:aminotransferase class III-fold pyridoxal phosphate-dependent enzyme [Clostridia bacterium]